MQNVFNTFSTSSSTDLVLQQTGFKCERIKEKYVLLLNGLLEKKEW